MAGEHAVGRLRALAEPLADLVRSMEYPALFEGPEPERGVTALRICSSPTASTAEPQPRSWTPSKCATAPGAPSQLRVLGGALARVPATRPPSLTGTAGSWRRSWRCTTARRSAPYTRPGPRPWRDALRDGEDGAYAGFLGDEGAARVRAAYPGAHWDRLGAIKAGI